jgi:hypothetical protein
MLPVNTASGIALNRTRAATKAWVNRRYFEWWILVQDLDEVVDEVRREGLGLLALSTFVDHWSYLFLEALIRAWYR